MNELVPGSRPCQNLLRRIEALAVPYGHEESFKMTPQRLLGERVLIGIHAESLAPQALFAIAFELGLPPAGHELLSEHLPHANAVFFGIEERADGNVCKIYLEFWDQVRNQVLQNGSREPLLLHLGVKWDTARPGHHEVAQYTCYPLLNARDVLRRMAGVYPKNSPPGTCDAAQGIVRRGLKHNPAAVFLYLEASESGNPRRSFDINMYKTGLNVAHASDELRQVAGYLNIPGQALEAQLQRLGPCPLGHISGGIDRHGEEFLSVYGEILPLADRRAQR